MLIEKSTYYDIKLVLDWVKQYNNIDKHEAKFIRFNNILVNPISQRYLTFQEKGTNCVSCDVKGIFFKLGLHTHRSGITFNKNTRWHFNLYGKDSYNNIILMTKDHIIAKANGGTNELNNYQTMCTICNREKDSN